MLGSSQKEKRRGRIWNANEMTYSSKDGKKRNKEVRLIGEKN